MVIEKLENAAGEHEIKLTVNKLIEKVEELITAHTGRLINVERRLDAMEKHCHKSSLGGVMGSPILPEVPESEIERSLKERGMWVDTPNPDDNYKCSQSVCRDSLVKTVRAERDDLLRDRDNYSKWLEENRYTINARNDEIVALKTEIKQLKFWKCQGDNVLAQANKRILRYEEMERRARYTEGQDDTYAKGDMQYILDAINGEDDKSSPREEFIVEQEKIMDAYEAEFQAISGIKPVPIEEQCLRTELIAFKGALDSVTDERDSLRDEITRYDGAVCALRDEYTRAVNGRETFPTILASVVKGILDAIGDKEEANR